MSQNPEETPGQSAGQEGSGTPSGSDASASGGSESADQRPYDQGPYDEDQTVRQTRSGQSPYDPGQAGQSPYGQGQPGSSGYDQGGSPSGGAGGQGGYGEYGQQADPNYGGQGQPPPAQGQDPTQGQPYGDPAGAYDPNAQYGAQPTGYPPQQYNQPGYPQQYAGQAPVSESDEKLWGLLTHISIPFFGFIGPLIVYLIFKDRSPWLKDTSTEALNFSILYTILSVISSILITVLIGLILLPIVFIAALIFCILAALAANRHELYRYPVNWRLIK